MGIVQIVCKKRCGYVIWDKENLAHTYKKCWFCSADVEILKELPKKRTPFFVNRGSKLVCAFCQHIPSKEEVEKGTCSSCGYWGSIYVYTMDDLFQCPNCGSQTPGDNVTGKGIEVCPKCSFSIPS